MGATLSIDGTYGEQLVVKRYHLREDMSGLFTIEVIVCTVEAEVDLAALVGKLATFRVAADHLVQALVIERTWKGVCRSFSQLRPETTGISTYRAEVVPRLWLLTQRTNQRLFQHKAIPDIVDQLVGEHAIDHVWRIDRAAYPRLELRTQYGESDYAFIARLLDEGGISFFFEHADEGDRFNLVLSDAPGGTAARPPLEYLEKISMDTHREVVTDVSIAEEVRPGRVSLRDHDFRQRSTFQFFGASPAPSAAEAALEQYHYTPGGFLMEVEGTPGVPATPGLTGGLPAVPLGGPVGTAANMAVSEIVSHVPGVAKAQEAVSNTLVGSLPYSAAKSVGQQVSHEVEKKVGGLLENPIERLRQAGGALGGLAGGLAGKLAGDIAGKAAGMLTGAFLRLVSDDKGAARHTEKRGNERALLWLESVRTGKRSVSFRTNAIDLRPGRVLSILGHPHPSLLPKHRLLVTACVLEGQDAEGQDAEGQDPASFCISVQAVFAEDPFRPALRTPRPKMWGVQSAVVVGPKGEEIYTDELARVRVQFHWDREGDYDDNSSCWMRVSQGWAGGGYGAIMVPRVGQEVLVAFLEGDPDHPIVVGHLYNATSKPPYDLPSHKTRSGWRSCSSPGGMGFNEIMFEDACGRELVYMQAEKDLEKVVKHDEAISIGHDQTRSVAHNRTTQIGAIDHTTVGAERRVTMVQAGLEAGIPPTEVIMIDRRIVLTTGEASLTLDGPNITMEAKGRIFMHSSEDDVEILGGPWVKINCGPVAEGQSDTYTSHHITGIVRDQDGKPTSGLQVVVKASDRTVQQVTTDSAGRYFALVPPGKCEVSIPGDVMYGTRSTNLDDMSAEPEELDDNGPVV